MLARKLSFATFAAAAIGTIAVLLFLQRFRIQPLTGPSPPHHQWLHKANDLFCTHYATEGNVSRRLTFVELIHETNGAVPLVRINHEIMPIPEARDRLRGFYAVRAERVVFVVDSPDSNQHRESEVMNMVKRLDVIDHVCVVDLKDPPAWYPPPEIVFPALKRAKTTVW